jgi:hypothetical protein
VNGEGRGEREIRRHLHLPSLPSHLNMFWHLFSFESSMIQQKNYHLRMKISISKFLWTIRKKMSSFLDGIIF